MRELDQILQATSQAIHDYESALREVERLEKNEIAIQKAIDDIKKKLDLYDEVRTFLQELAEVTREEIASDLEQVVTLCLQAVFGEAYSFEIDIETSRNNTVIYFYVVKSSGPIPVRQQPDESMGGGILDTCSIGLRFGLLQILNPKPLGPIILDEPAKQVSGGYIEGIASLIKELSPMFKKQTIYVTHHVPIMDVIEHSIYFENVNGYTKTMDGNERSA